jgi:hypothetical protein
VVERWPRPGSGAFDGALGTLISIPENASRGQVGARGTARAITGLITHDAQAVRVEARSSSDVSATSAFVAPPGHPRAPGPAGAVAASTKPIPKASVPLRLREFVTSAASKVTSRLASSEVAATGGGTPSLLVADRAEARRYAALAPSARTYLRSGRGEPATPVPKSPGLYYADKTIGRVTLPASPSVSERPPGVVRPTTIPLSHRSLPPRVPNLYTSGADVRGVRLPSPPRVSMRPPDNLLPVYGSRVTPPATPELYTTETTSIGGVKAAVPRTPGLYTAGTEKTVLLPSKPAPPKELVTPPTKLDPSRLWAHATPGILLESAVSLGHSSTHFLEFRELVPGPPGVAIVERGTYPDEPVDRTNWEIRGPDGVYEDIKSATSAKITIAVQRLRTAMLLDGDLDDVVDSDPLYVALNKDPAAAIGPGENRVEKAPNFFGDRKNIWFLEHFCYGASAQCDPDSYWCPGSQGDDLSKVSTATHNTIFYQTGGMAALGGFGADFFVEYYNREVGGWVPAYEVGLRPGEWAIFTWQGELTFRATISARPGSLVHFFERYRRAPTYFTHAGTYPKNWGWNFANDIQGVTHDDEYWYFSRTQYPDYFPDKYGELLRIPLGTDLKAEDKFDDPSRQPAPLDEARYDHYGDISYHAGNIFVSLQGDEQDLFAPPTYDPNFRRGAIVPRVRLAHLPSRCAVGVFRPDLKLIGFANLRTDGGCGWLAYNPRDNQLYIATPNTPNKDDELPAILSRYRVSVGRDVAAAPGDADVPLVAPLVISQGGAFSDRGVFWTVTGDTFTLYAIDVNNGFIYHRGKIGYGTGSIAVKAIKDHFGITGPEVEGVTIWDLSRGQAPHIGGHLHVQFNDFPDNDNLSFLHLSANTPEAM